METNIISKQEYYQDLYQACKFIVDVSNNVDTHVAGGVQMGSWSFMPYLLTAEYTYEDKFRFEVNNDSEIVITGAEPPYKITINLHNSPEDCIKTLEEINKDHSDIIFDILQLRDILPNILFESTKEADRVIEYSKEMIKKCESWKEYTKQLLNKKSCL